MKRSPGRSITLLDNLAAERRICVDRMPRRPKAVILFPAPYSAAIANLGFLTIWGRLNRVPGFSCDRAVWDPRTASFSPALESGLPIHQFPLIFISSTSELDLITVIDGLLAAEIEPEALKRTGRDPFIVGGGITFTLNPQPWAPIVDLAILGEGEEAVLDWLQVYLDWSAKRGTKAELRSESQNITSAWLPGDTHRTVVAAKYVNYPADPAISPVIHPQGHFGDCLLVEITRGCPRHCSFCAVCGVYPARFAEPDAILSKIAERKTLGAKKVGLLGAATGDHPQLKPMIRALAAEKYELTISSLRIERSDEELLELLVKSGLRTLTVAPEAGSEVLRNRIGKKSSDADLLRLVELAGILGLHKVRLYFLIGLPEPEPAEAIIDLVKRLRQAAPVKLGLDLSVASFIPKPGTLWERAPFAATPELEAIKKLLRRELSGLARVNVEFESTRMERQAALLSRGDAEMGSMALRSRRSHRSLEQELRLSGGKMEGWLGGISEDRMLPWHQIKSAE
ncbi:MAG: radical SAM protein [bacterium]|nr:radical SAM protein [bacterium]